MPRRCRSSARRSSRTRTSRWRTRGSARCTATSTRRRCRETRSRKPTRCAIAAARGVGSVGVRGQLYALAVVRRDEREVAGQLAAGRKLNEGCRMLNPQAFVAMYEGRLARATELCEQFTAEASSRIGLNGAAANLWSNLAQGAATFGDADA